ncbi:MAG: bacteriophage abortive infection AbiH family protein [Bacilli bacterium]|nr:bacteriophage abortive infection AbiH family protein [Bacilli bacterium]
MEHSTSDTLVIGNGYDLACGLKSSFADYISYAKKRSTGFAKYLSFCGKAIQRPDYPKGYSVYDNAIASACKGLNLWLLVLGAISVYFSGKEELFWSDVEEAIHDIVYKKKNPNGKYTRFDPVQIFDTAYYLADEKEFDERYAGVALGLASALLNYEPELHPTKKTDPASIHRFYLAQLRKFEHGFSEYLSHTLKHAENYEERSRDLFDCLCALNGTENDSLSNVISFNYVPFSRARFPILVDNHLIGHVHGEIDGSILIGVMPLGEEYEPFESTYWFSKEYRRFDLLGHPNNAIRMPSIGQGIVFFGLSLSRQDYHTVFRIFDALLETRDSNLAGIPPLSGRTLTFAYYVYDPAHGEAIKARLFSSIKDALIAWNKLRKMHWPNVIDDLIDLGVLSICEIKKDKHGKFYPAKER